MKALLQTSSDRALAAACDRVRDLAGRTRSEGPWASGCFAELAARGILARFVPADCGGPEECEGMPADEPTLLTVLAGIARVCLTTALALSQWASAVRLLAAADDGFCRSLLPDLAAGRRFTTVGISQLTTSRRHVASAPVVASSLRSGAEGWRIDGCCPWVTGGDSVDTIVTAAAVANADGLPPDAAFFVVERPSPGVLVEPPLPLLALGGSRTSQVRLDGVRPLASIPMSRGGVPRAGGLATSALAIGAARGSADILTSLASEPPGRPDVARVAEAIESETDSLFRRLTGTPAADQEAREALRSAANGLVARAASAALLAAKGAGFVEGHPAGRACLEALFFQVWSCPQPVTERTLCELAGLAP